jgi:hypothetical protein
MIEVPSGAVQLAMLEKAHRQAVEAVMHSDMGDVARIARVLAMEAEYLGLMEKLRAAQAIGPAPKQAPRRDERVDRRA